MAARKAAVRRAAGAALALVLALAVVGSVAAATARDPNTANGADESEGHEPGSNERHTHLEPVYGQLGERGLLRL
jgi:hypothetical protein